MSVRLESGRVLRTPEEIESWVKEHNRQFAAEQAAWRKRVMYNPEDDARYPDGRWPESMRRYELAALERRQSRTPDGA